MIELILKNKEWLFSGAGIAALGIVFGLLKRQQPKQPASQVVIHAHNDSNDQSVGSQEVEPANIEKSVRYPLKP